MPDADVLRLRAVHRAAADLRRGTPVLLTGEVPLILLAAETAGPRGLAELAMLAAEPPVLLLAPMRAAAVLHRPVEQGSPVVALHISSELLAPEPLRGLADPTVEELLPAQPEPADGARTGTGGLDSGQARPSVAGRAGSAGCGPMSTPTPRGWACSAFRPPI